MNKEEAQDLLKRYANNQCTPEEKILVERWYLKESERVDSDPADDDMIPEADEMWAGTLQKAGLSAKQSKTRFAVRIAAAATVLLFIAFGAYFYTERGKQPVQTAATKIDPPPGGDKAVLTLSDGSRIILDDIASGTLARQGNITIQKSASGEITYDASAATGETATGYNTISTPRGGEYRVVLPDGSKVWLNSASSIYFPTIFIGGQRNVTVTGEAYFEVAKDPSRPFNVSSNGIEISVLGTHFNLMAYNDEASVKATLIEGSIRVSAGKSSALVKPGEQAEILNRNITVNPVDVEEAVAWKNGYFYFKGTDLRSVMRQLSRWYDVDVEYSAEIPETVFSGKMYRNVNASNVLEILSYFKVNFRIEEAAGPSGRRKIVIL